jgi:hypothetical protein
MRTAEGVRSLIEKIYKDCEPAEMPSDSELKKARLQLSFLKTVVLYLETNPNEDFIKQENEEIDRILVVINNGYETWSKNTPTGSVLESQKRAIYNKERDYARWVQQKKILEFILE